MELVLASTILLCIGNKIKEQFWQLGYSFTPVQHGMDSSYGYGSHFGLQVLVLPVHPIKVAAYAQHLALLKQRARIALADIPPSTTQSSIHNLLAPSPTTRGHINLDFVEEWDTDLAWLDDFQAHRKIMGVVGIMDCAEWANEPNGLAEGVACFEYQMRQKAPKPDRIFAKRCYAFSPTDGQNDNAEGLVVIPNVGDQAFYVHTLLAELASAILAGLSAIMISLDARSYVGTPKEPLFSMTSVANSYFPSIQAGSIQARPSIDGKADHVGSPASAGAPANMLPNRGASPHIFESTRSASPMQPVIKTRITSISGSVNPSPTSIMPEAPDAKARKKLPARILKLKGDLFCLVGKVSEGMSWCVRI